MKRSLPMFLLTTLLLGYNLESNNGLYARSIPGNKGNDLVPVVFEKTSAANSLNKSNSIVNNTLPTLNADLYLLNPDSSVKAADGAVAQYDNSFSTAISYLDAPKMTNLNENLAFQLQGKLFSIVRRPVIHICDTLFLNLTNTTKRSYQFQFTSINLTQPGLFGFLKDSYTGDSTLINLNGFTVYNFSLNNDIASQNPNRFTIVFEPLVSGGPLPVTFTSISAAQQNNNIALEWKVENEMNIKNYSVERSADGHTFNSIATISTNSSNSSLDVYDWVDLNAISGVSFYRVRSTGTNGSVQFSEIVKVSTVSQNARISIYPNPVKSGIIGLQFTNMPKGAYQLRMLNSFGQSVASKLINHSGGSATQTLSFGNNLPRGLYELEIIQPGKSTVTLSVEYQ